MDNQTLAKYISRHDLGTGIFGYLDKILLRLRKEFVRDISYEECVERGKEAEVFKWVPNNVASLEEIRASKCGQRCVDSCVGLGCLCNGIIGKCE